MVCATNCSVFSRYMLWKKWKKEKTKTLDHLKLDILMGGGGIQNLAKSSSKRFTFFVFSFFPGHISGKSGSIFSKSLKIEPNLAKSSSRWSTFFVFSFFLNIYIKNWTNCCNPLQIEPFPDDNGVSRAKGVGREYAESGEIELQMVHFFRFSVFPGYNINLANSRIRWSKLFVFSWTYIWKNMNNLQENS